MTRNRSALLYSLFAVILLLYGIALPAYAQPETLQPQGSDAQQVQQDQAQPPTDAQAPATNTGGTNAEAAAIPPRPAIVPEATLPHDLSPWGMFLAADIVVKSVMIGLVLASIATWAVWFAKSLGFYIANRRLRQSLELVNSSSLLSDASLQAEKVHGLGRHLIQAAAHEFGAGSQSRNMENLKERIALRLEVLTAVGAREIARGTGLLASVGSVAPFVGLFGTVWGIMNSFIGISKTQTTNLAVVAPGIAEALLATALGLAAAIPAVVFYNQFARAAARYKLGLNELASGVKRLVLRELDAKSDAHGAVRGA